MSDYITNDTELQSVANAIREKGGTTTPLVYPTGFVSAIEAIETSSGGVTDISSYLEVEGESTLYAASSINQLKGYKIGDDYYVVAMIFPEFANNGYFVRIGTSSLPPEYIDDYMNVPSAFYCEYYDESDGASDPLSDGIDRFELEHSFNSSSGMFNAYIYINENVPLDGVLVVNLCFIKN